MVSGTRVDAGNGETAVRLLGLITGVIGVQAVCGYWVEKWGHLQRIDGKLERWVLMGSFDIASTHACRTDDGAWEIHGAA